MLLHLSNHLASPHGCMYPRIVNLGDSWIYFVVGMSEEILRTASVKRPSYST
jgi:hypothetical protein